MSDDNEQIDLLAEYVKEKRRTVWGWVKEHDKQILASATIVLAVKNRKLKKQNNEMVKNLKDAKKFVHDARVAVEAANIFEYYFGSRR